MVKIFLRENKSIYSICMNKILFTPRRHLSMGDFKVGVMASDKQNFKPANVVDLRRDGILVQHFTSKGFKGLAWRINLWSTIQNCLYRQ